MHPDIARPLANTCWQQYSNGHSAVFRFGVLPLGEQVERLALQGRHQQLRPSRSAIVDLRAKVITLFVDEVVVILNGLIVDEADICCRGRFGTKFRRR